MPRTQKLTADPTVQTPKFCPHCGWEFKEGYDVFCGGCARRHDGMSRPNGCGDECQRCKAQVLCPRDHNCAACGATVPS